MALVGLIALAVPIAIHIIATRRAERVPFPTLRFIRAGRLASVRRRALEEAPLLVVRMMILAAAVIALAGPLVVTARRQAEWNARTQTVVVADPNLGDGIARAVRTLMLAPPGRREIVVRSAFPIGSLIDTDLMAATAAGVGLRFERTGTLPPERTVELPPVLTESGARMRTMTVSRDGTSVSLTPSLTPSQTPSLTPPQTRSLTPSLTPGLRAVLAEQVLAPKDGRRVRLVFAGAPDFAASVVAAVPVREPWIADALASVARDRDVKAASAQLKSHLVDTRLTRSPWIVVANDADGQPLAAGASVDGMLTVVSAAPADAFVSAVLLRAAMNAIGDRTVPASAETLSIPDEQLKAWTRAPGPAPAPRSETIDEDDRRWLWMAALALLGVEWWRRDLAEAPTCLAEAPKARRRKARRRTVLPDERAFVALVDRALWRARLLAVAEALACAAGVAAIAPIEAAVLVSVLVATLRLRHWSRPVMIQRIERATPASRNLFVTAGDLSRGTLTAADRIRDRVFADVSRVPANINRAVPASPLVMCAAVSAVVWVCALGAGRIESTVARIVAPASSSPAADRAKSMRIAATLHPPAYTGVADSQTVDPAELRAIEGSVATLNVDTASPRITIDHDGAVATLTPDSAGRFSARLTLKKTGYLVLAADGPDGGDRRTLPIVVAPDALPTVRITAPGRDLVYSDDSASIAFSARARDDYGLRSLSLRYTKVSGSGEEFEFSEGEIPLKMSAATARDWTGTATRTLAELGLHEGDMLVYRAVAADQRPGDGRAESDAFFVEISRLGVAAGDAFTLPEQETKYALSQQMLIVKTDRLVKQRTAMAPDQFGEASLNLAVEQRMIRAEFVFMLGGEVEDEEVEAERSVELQSGRLANRGQSDLRAATIAMSQAEKLLTAGNPADALVAERNAVTALQRAFARDRYILRASPSRVDLDPKRRLTGDLSKASGWTRVLPDTPANRRAAQLQDLLRGLADLGAAPDRSRALVLAETALRLDANSEPLRNAAAALQRDGGVPDAIAAIIEETKRALSAAPAVSIDVAPGLRRALAERSK